MNTQAIKASIIQAACREKPSHAVHRRFVPRLLMLFRHQWNNTNATELLVTRVCREAAAKLEIRRLKHGNELINHKLSLITVCKQEYVEKNNVILTPSSYVESQWDYKFCLSEKRRQRVMSLHTVLPAASPPLSKYNSKSVRYEINISGMCVLVFLCCFLMSSN